ncbi:MAG: GNAT family N-acetyltransferase [Phycisphaerales bacterium]|nr:MAG: GNAT family N-acetyltransferase [Phycisphaerales bacterium]
MEVEYLPDSSIDASLDAELRALLTTCFTKPQDVVFKDQRYFCEPYPHRWVIRDTNYSIIAHAGIHEKVVEADGRRYRIGGLAEVCVHPDYRGQGFVKAMVACIDDWLFARGYDFAVLFGESYIYQSSGYVEVSNLVYDEVTPSGEKYKAPEPAMVKPLAGIPWPAGEVYLPGPKF